MKFFSSMQNKLSDKKNKEPLKEEVRSLHNEFAELQRQKSSSSSSSEVDLDEEGIDRTIRIILGRICKEYACEKKRAIGNNNKSLYLLLKKLFVCTNGFSSSPPSLSGAFQESRMEKTKKIYPRDSPGVPPTKRCMEDYSHKYNDEEKILHEIKWDKTDDEFIVLEILPI